MRYHIHLLRSLLKRKVSDNKKSPAMRGFAILNAWLWSPGPALQPRSCRAACLFRHAPDDLARLDELLTCISCGHQEDARRVNSYESSINEILSDLIPVIRLRDNELKARIRMLCNLNESKWNDTLILSHSRRGKLWRAVDEREALIELL